MIQSPPCLLRGMPPIASKVRLIKSRLESMVFTIHPLAVTIIITQVRCQNGSLSLDMVLLMVYICAQKHMNLVANSLIEYEFRNCSLSN